MAIYDKRQTPVKKVCYTNGNKILNVDNRNKCFLYRETLYNQVIGGTKKLTTG